jgi:hypothetical protein
MRRDFHYDGLPGNLSRNIYVCDVQVTDRPVAGVHTGDIAICIDTITIFFWTGAVWVAATPAPSVGPTLSSAVGTSANAYASILSLAGAGGILGHGTVKNTLGVNTITIRRSGTDAFGVSQTTEDDILPSASMSYDISEPIGTAVPPYTAFAVEVKSKVGGAHSDYNLKNTSI